MKCYWTVNFIFADAKRRSIWIVYCSITLHVQRNKSQQLFYYITRYFSWKVCHLRQISVDVLRFYYITRYFSWKVCHLRQISVDVLHKPCDIMTLRHRLWDISWSDVIVHATLGRYVTNHATSSIVDLMWLASRPMKLLLFIDYIIILDVAWFVT